MICEQGDIVSINFDPSRRHEPAGRHYALVISPWKVNWVSSLCIMCPITSTNNGYPFHVRIADGNPVFGYVQCEAIRAMDLGARELERPDAVQLVGAVDDGTLAAVLACVKIVCGLDG